MAYIAGVARKTCRHEPPASAAFRTAAPQRPPPARAGAGGWALCPPMVTPAARLDALSMSPRRAHRGAHPGHSQVCQDAEHSPSPVPSSPRPRDPQLRVAHPRRHAALATGLQPHRRSHLRLRRCAGQYRPPATTASASRCSHRRDERQRERLCQRVGGLAFPSTWGWSSASEVIRGPSALVYGGDSTLAWSIW